MARPALLAAALAALLVPARAFVDYSFPNETFTYRGRQWTVPVQPRTPGYFDWDTVAGCVDYSGAYHYNCPGARKITLSLDDGPAPLTARVLDILRENDAKATFCLMGIKMTPETEALVRRMADEGHDLCIHTENHLHLTQLSTQSIIDEITWVMDKFKAILGVTPRYFRPPFGESDMRVRAVVEQLNLTMFLWNLDSWDWKQNSTESVERLRGAMATTGTWQWANPAGESYEVLAHDIHRVTVEEFVPAVVREARAQGWRMVGPSDATCTGKTRWIEGGEDVYAREKGRARGLAAANIQSLLVPLDYEQQGAAPPPEASNFGKPSTSTSSTTAVATPAMTPVPARPTGAAVDDNVANDAAPKTATAGRPTQVAEPSVPASAGRAAAAGAGIVAALAGVVAALV
ncbi:hypothetical protein DFJ74DRAFT_696378 [Hyaloraphidium curvatum]|nr:hypothetical protein DFJ74DRAFT_696378 [Hyaloraphidium curvatum]